MGSEWHMHIDPHAGHTPLLHVTSAQWINVIEVRVEVAGGEKWLQEGGGVPCGYFHPFERF
jgi:hypothetical protein